MNTTFDHAEPLDSISCASEISCENPVQLARPTMQSVVTFAASNVNFRNGLVLAACEDLAELAFQIAVDAAVDGTDSELRRLAEVAYEAVERARLTVHAAVLALKESLAADAAWYCRETGATHKVFVFRREIAQVTRSAAKRAIRRAARKLEAYLAAAEGPGTDQAAGY